MGKRETTLPDPPALRRGDCMMLAGAIRCAERLLAGDAAGAERAATYFVMAKDASKEKGAAVLNGINAVNDAVWGAGYE